MAGASCLQYSCNIEICFDLFQTKSLFLGPCLISLLQYFTIWQLCISLPRNPNCPVGHSCIKCWERGFLVRVVVVVLVVVIAWVHPRRDGIEKEESWHQRWEFSSQYPDRCCSWQMVTRTVISVAGDGLGWLPEVETHAFSFWQLLSSHPN